MGEMVLTLAIAVAVSSVTSITILWLFGVFDETGRWKTQKKKEESTGTHEQVLKGWRREPPPLSFKRVPETDRLREYGLSGRDYFFVPRGEGGEYLVAPDKKDTPEVEIKRYRKAVEEAISREKKRVFERLLFAKLEDAEEGSRRVLTLLSLEKELEELEVTSRESGVEAHAGEVYDLIEEVLEREMKPWPEE